MKRAILLLAVSASLFLFSCTTAYKTGQTPDDVYYSPARPEEEYVDRDNNREERYSEEYYEDRYLRMKVRNRYRWDELNDWSYYGNRYNYSHFNYNYWNNPWSPYNYWNHFYNPYYSNVIVLNPKNTFNRPRTFNLNTYNSNSLTNKNYSTPVNPKARTSSSYTPSRTTSNSPIRDLFKSNNSSNNNSTNTKSSSNSSSGSSGGSKPAPVRRF